MSDDKIDRGKSQLFNRIALEFSDPEHVLKAIENRKRRVRPELEANFVEPSNPIHKQLAEIWIEVLGIERVGIHDNFFKLGGNSILATQLLARVRESFQVEVPLRSIFETPTIADLSVTLIQNRAASIESQELEGLMARLEQLSEEEAQNMLDAQVNGAPSRTTSA